MIFCSGNSLREAQGNFLLYFWFWGGQTRIVGERPACTKWVVVSDPDAIQVIREFLEPLGITVQLAAELDSNPEPALVATTR